MKAFIILVIVILICVKILIIDNIFYKNHNNHKNHKNHNNHNNHNNLNKGESLYNSSSIRNIKKIKENTFYNRGTLPENIKNKLDLISNHVLKELNYNNNLDFNKTGYDNILIKSDYNNNRNYIYDLFIYDKRNNYDLKLKVNLIYYNDEIIKKKLMPSPMEIISIPNNLIIDIDLKKNKQKLNKQKLNIHINFVDIINSTLFTSKLDLINTTNTDNIKISNNSFKGLNDTSNEFTLLKPAIRTPYIEKYNIRNKWPELNIKSSLLKVVQKNWNEWGVPSGFLNIKRIQSLGSNNPTVNKHFGSSGRYNNMFMKTNASGAVSSSDSQPAP